MRQRDASAGFRTAKAGRLSCELNPRFSQVSSFITAESSFRCRRRYRHNGAHRKTSSAAFLAARSPIGRSRIGRPWAIACRVDNAAADADNHIRFHVDCRFNPSRTKPRRGFGRTRRGDGKPGRFLKATAKPVQKPLLTALPPPYTTSRRLPPCLTAASAVFSSASSPNITSVGQ